MGKKKHGKTRASSRNGAKQVLGKTRHDASFGIVPVHERDGVRRFLLIQHLGGHWGFPKGHPEKGESPVETARRECFVASHRAVHVRPSFSTKPCVACRSDTMPQQ